MLFLNDTIEESWVYTETDFGEGLRCMAAIILLIGGMSRVNVYLTFRMLLYFRISNSVMLSSDNGNILIIGLSFQGTVLNVFFSVFNVIRYNSNGIL